MEYVGEMEEDTSDDVEVTRLEDIEVGNRAKALLIYVALLYSLAATKAGPTSMSRISGSSLRLLRGLDTVSRLLLLCFTLILMTA